MKALFAALLAAPLLAAAPVPPLEIDANALLAAYAKSWALADAAGLAGLYEPDADLMSVAGPAHGRNEISQLYAAAFASMPGSRLTPRIEALRPIAPQLAVARGVWTIAASAVGGGQPTRACGRFTGVLRRAAGGWRIVVFDEVPLACDATAP